MKFNVKMVGDFIAHGSYGCTFEYGKNRVVKFEPVDDDAIANYLALLWWITDTRPDYIVKVFDFGEIKLPRRLARTMKAKLELDDCPRGVFFYTVMERLNDFSYSDKAYESRRKVQDICDNVHPIYEDTHLGNLMEDSSGRVKIIDLGGFFYENAPYEALYSDWRNELNKECNILRTGGWGKRFRPRYDSVEEYEKGIRYMTPIDYLLARLA